MIVGGTTPIRLALALPHHSAVVRLGLDTSNVRHFSSSSALLYRMKKSLLRIRATERKEVNQLRQKYIVEKNSTVDPVLGLPNNRFLSRLEAEIKEPNVLTKSYNINEVHKLLHGARWKQNSESDPEKQAEVINRVLTMKNGSEADAMKLKVELARKEFQRFDGDTGSSEVQAAIATIRINQLYKHCQQNKKDFQNTRQLRMLVQKRQRALRYLKKDNPERYYWAINKLGMTDHIVHMEFNMDKAYMQKFKMYGDRVLVKESHTVREEDRKARRKEKKILKRKTVKELRAMKRAIDKGVTASL